MAGPLATEARRHEIRRRVAAFATHPTKTPAGPGAGRARDRRAAAAQAASAALAFAAMALNASGSLTARSASTLRSTSSPDFARPSMKRE